MKQLSFLDRPFGSGIEKKLLEAIEDMTPADIDSVVAMHERYIYFGILFELGPAFLRLFYRQVINDPSARGYVIRIEGRVVGFIAGSRDPETFFRELFGRFFFRIGYVILKTSIFRPSFPLIFAQRVLVNMRKENVAELLSIAVEKRYQAGGYGYILYKKLFHDFKQSGVKRIQGDVAENVEDPAIMAIHKMYNNNGFVQTAQFRVGRVSYRRYQRDLR